MKTKFIIFAVLVAATLFLTYCTKTTSEKQPMTQQELVERGKYLVKIGGCNDCHTPKNLTEMGPMPDTTRLLMGHPANLAIPEIPAGVIAPDKWAAMTNIDMTAWAGLWGVSFSANLTPENLTGSGAWTEAAFMQAMRNGKHLGSGRPILPPMPWQAIGQLSDDDLKSIYAYLKSIKPIENMVPLPIPPGGQQ